MGNNKKGIIHSIITYLFIIAILFIFAYFVNNLQQNDSDFFSTVLSIQPNKNTQDQKGGTGQAAPVMSQNKATTSTTSGSTQKSNNTNENNSIDKSILIEMLQQVKYYNEVLNLKQADNLKIVIYVLTFISLIAAFFGYRTIKDIKDNLNSKTEEVTSFYKETAQILKDQSSTSKNFYDSYYKELTVKVQEEKLNIQRLKKETEELDKTVNKNIEIFSELLNNYRDLDGKYEKLSSELNIKRENLLQSTQNEITTAANEEFTRRQ